MANKMDTVINFDKNINLKQCTEDLQSEVKTERKRALEKIVKELNDTKLKDSSDFVQIFPCIHTYVLRCFSDKAEVCRELSAEIISLFIENLPLNDYYLTYIIPVIAKRIGMVETIEGSEEIRLKLVTLVRQIVFRYKDTAYLSPFFNDFTNILVKTVTDPYPKVKLESCETIILLSNAIKKDFHMQSESYVKPVVSNFSHQHFRVRVAAIRCIGSVVANGNAKCFENSVTPMAEKLFDEVAPVRLQVIKEVGLWMLHHRDRYSYWHRMIPLLLTGLSDVIDDIRNETSQLWDEVGKQFIKENEEDLKSQMDFLREGPNHYPPVPRPNLGCRTLVERNIGKIIPAIARELDGWQRDARLRSSQLVCWLVLCAEQSILQHSATVVRCFLLGAKDEDSKVYIEIYRASELFGYFVAPQIWWELLHSEVDNWPCLGVLANIIKGSKPENLKDVYLIKITKKLSKPYHCRIRKDKYQNNLLNTCESIMSVCPEDCQNISQELFNIIFTVYSMPCGTDIEHKALCLLEKLRSTISCGSHLSDLFCQYISFLLGNITTDAHLWTLYTPERCILDTILIHTGPALGLNLHLLSPLLVEALSSNEIDAEVKLKLFTSLSSVLLNRDENFELASEMHLQAFLNIILEDAIMPNLVWTAGKTAESIRTAAVCCLCAVLQDNELLNQDTYDVDFRKCIKQVELFPSKESLEPHVDKLLPLLISLVDDNSKITRLYSLRAICCVTKLAKKKACFSHEHLHKSYPVVMKRLDDSNDKVRLASIQSLSILFTSRTEPYDIVTFGTHMEAVYSSMLIHLDDPEEVFQKEILDALKTISDIHPIMLKKKVVDKMNVFRNKFALETLDKHLETLLLQNNSNDD